MRSACWASEGQCRAEAVRAGIWYEIIPVGSPNTDEWFAHCKHFPAEAVEPMGSLAKPQDYS